MEEVTKCKGHKMLVNVIEPEKCILDDLEILAFENEDQLNLYTVWHEALFDKRRELNAESERERQIIRNEIVRKTRQLIGSVGSDEDLPVSKKSKSKSASRSFTQGVTASSNSAPPARTSPVKKSSTSSSSALRVSPLRAAIPNVSTPDIHQVEVEENEASLPLNNTVGGNVHPPRVTATAKISKPKHIAHGSQPLPHGLVLHNSSQYGYNTLPDGKKLLRYKLNKMYNKYRGRQIRRNLVNEKQRNSKIDAEVRKSYLNPWLAYCALQALRFPADFNTSMYMDPNSIMPVDMSQDGQAKKKKKKKKKPKPDEIQAVNTTTSTNINNTTQSMSILSKPANHSLLVNPPPYQIVYVNPGTVITYSNRINPQQVADYRQKSHLLPSSASSKKSSAASYDVFEIMEVLANTTKTNVTITRNSHRPNPNQTGAEGGSGGAQSGSIYSHSMNVNTPGIVSTQLHHQAKSYLDSMSKFYAEERQRIKEEEERLKNESYHYEFINGYLRKFRSTPDSTPAHPLEASSEIDPDHERHG